MVGTLSVVVAAPVASAQPEPNLVVASRWLLGNVDCPSPGLCVAVGDYLSSDGQGNVPVVNGLLLTDGSGRWSAMAAPLPGGASSLDSVVSTISCPSPACCLAVGGYSDQPYHADIAPPHAFSLTGSPGRRQASGSSLPPDHGAARHTAE